MELEVGAESSSVPSETLEASMAILRSLSGLGELMQALFSVSY